MISLLLALSPARARADEALQLDEITVEASRVDELLPARSIVDRAELTDSHKTDLPAVLDLTPGVNVRDGGRGESRLDVRGFDQRAVLVTLNGVPVFEPWNGIINLSLFPIEMLESVEVDRGPSSALFGPNGMGGTVKMTTRLPAGPVEANASTIWHDSDTWDARASGGVAQGGVVGLLGGRYFTSPGFPLPGDFDDLKSPSRKYENGGLRLNSDREDKSVFTNLAYDYGDAGRAHLTFLGSTSSFGIPPSTTAFLGPFRRDDAQDLYHAQSGFEQRLLPNVGVAAAGFYTAYDVKETEYTNETFSHRKATTVSDSDELGGIARLTYDIGAVDSLAAAAQLRRDGADISNSTVGRTAEPNFTTSSVAVENVYQLTENVAIVTGTSLDMQNGGGDGTQWELDPQGGLSVDFGEYGISRAGISRKVRFPTLRELFDPVQGFSKLKPEKAVVYEVGHRLQVAHGYADLNLFRSDVTDLIENQGGDLGQAQNVQDATLQGVEVAAGGTPVDWARLDINYTYLDTEAHLTSRLGTANSSVQHRPPHRFNGILNLFLPLEFVLRLEGLYTAEQLDQFGSDNSVNPYTLFNVQLTRHFGERFQIFAGADNILDDEHQDKLGTPGPGRWVFSGVRMAYN